MVKRRKEEKNKPNRFDEHFQHMGWISVLLLVVAFVYVLYYLYVVVSTGQDPAGTVLKDFTELVSNVFKLFVDE